MKKLLFLLILGLVYTINLKAQNPIIDGPDKDTSYIINWNNPQPIENSFDLKLNERNDRLERAQFMFCAGFMTVTGGIMMWRSIPNRRMGITCMYIGGITTIWGLIEMINSDN